MEAYKLVFIVDEPDGNKKVMVQKTWAATGFEAAEKSKLYLETTFKFKKVTLLKWKVLPSGSAHF
jgi:hypothetical protein